MKIWIPIVVLLLIGSTTLAQDAPKRIALAPRSTIQAGELTDWMDKEKKCSNVVFTSDESKADYLLEVKVMTGSALSENTTSTEYQLLSLKGEVLFKTSVRHYKSAMKDVCNYITSGNKKK